MKPKIILSVLLVGISVAAQTNVPQYVTNYVESADLREVNGRTYRIQSSPVEKKAYGGRTIRAKQVEDGSVLPPWVQLHGKIIDVQTQGIVLQVFTEKNTYETTYHPARTSYSQSIGSFSSGASAARTSKKLVDTELIPEKQLFITNALPDCAVGQNVKIIALKIGTTQARGEVLELWDRGQQGRAAIISINPQYAQREAETKRDVNKIKALTFNQTQAEKGDAYGQFRMGERYRDGDGVKKDEATAREYFTKAASQGHGEAAKALQDMKVLATP